MKKTAVAAFVAALTIFSSGFSGISDTLPNGILRENAVYADFDTSSEQTDETTEDTQETIALSECEITFPHTRYVYTGKAIKPPVTVKYNGVELSSSYYSVSYSNNTKVGKATVTVKAKGDVTTGKAVKTFVVMPKKNTVKSLSSPKEGKIKVSWNKDSNAKGYHILYSTDKNFKKNVSYVTVYDTSKTSKTISDSNIVKGKTYYVKVRSFIRVGGKVYGAYGKAKSVKIPSQSYGLVEKSKAVDKSYFDDAAFVGDSISLKLSQYQSSTSSLGKAKFFASGSLSAANALWPVSSQSVHPRYNGVKTKVEDCIQKSGAKKVYIMLGMNDIGAYGLDKSIQNYKTLISRIKAKSPNVTIFIESMTPLASTSRSSGRKLNNTNIKKYNEMLKKMCEENHWYFIDVGSVMYDSSGKYLNPSYCSDPNAMGMHFTTAGCKQWVNYLLTHTVEL